MANRPQKTDESVENGHLVKKRFDFNSYDVDLNDVCTGIKTRPIVNIGVVDCMVVD
jgi:hypothetical protein